MFVGNLKEEAVRELKQALFVSIDVFRGFLPQGRLFELNHLGRELYRSHQEARDLNHEVAVALAFDAHDDALTAIVEASLDTDAVAFLETDLFGTEVRDMLFTVLRDRDEVFHRLSGNHEIILKVGEGGFADEDRESRLLSIGFEGFQLAFGKDKTAQGRDELALLLATNGFDLVAKGYKSIEARFTGFVAYLYFLSW